MSGAFAAAGLTVTVAGVGPVCHVAFIPGPITRYRDLLVADTRLYSAFALG